MDPPHQKNVPLVPAFPDGHAYGQTGFDPHPAVGAFILSTAVVMIGLNTFPLFQLGTAALSTWGIHWFKIGLGLLLWLIGMAFLARSRYMTWGSGVGYGILLLPGLVLLLWRSRHATRRSAWDSKEELMRRFRPMRPLYVDGFRRCAKPRPPIDAGKHPASS